MYFCNKYNVMRYFISIVIFICISQAFYAQEITDSTAPAPKYIETFQLTHEGQGSIVIKQDERISNIVDNHIAINIQNESKISGWRVQIYNSSGAESRKEAQDVRNKFLEKYPELTAYVIYQPPFFKIRVGDFRTREDAYMVYKKIVEEFPVSYLVNDLINLPKL